jgi:hypothetical protein
MVDKNGGESVRDTEVNPPRWLAPFDADDENDECSYSRQ